MENGNSVYLDEMLRHPHIEAEEAWICNRFDTLTAKESIILAAAMQRSPPENARDAINLLIDLRDYTVCSAESYDYLADFYLQEHGIALPNSVMDFTDMAQIGRMYEDEHPGLFIGEYYVAYPKRASPQLYSGSNLEVCADRDWSVKLKLASKLHPEGVWLRLPDYADVNDGSPDEIGIALKELGVDKVTDCALLAAVCVLPEAGNLMEQYCDAADLIYDGQNLGFVLDEQGQGVEYFREKFAAAIALEDCQTLKEVLDVAENLGCYYFVPESELSIVATEELLKQKIPPNLIDSGAIDLADYADSLLRDRGYEQMISDAHIRRAENYPQHGQNQGSPDSGMQMA